MTEGMDMSIELHSCRNCGTGLGSGSRRYCKKAECQRAAARARKAAQREREASPGSESTAEPKEPERGPVGPIMSYETKAAITQLGECWRCFGTPVYGDTVQDPFGAWHCPIHGQVSGVPL